MPQNATSEALPLSGAQESALTSLLAGKNVTEAATAAGVDRSSIHRWLKIDFNFQAALNRGRHDLREAVQARLLAMAQKATETIEKRIEAGDPSISLAILKGLGLLNGEAPMIGRDDPAVLEKQANRQRFRDSLI